MRTNKTFTVGAAPINVVTGTTSAPAVSTPPKYATRIFAQMLTGGSGMGYVLDGINIGRTPASTPVDDDITAEMAPASAGAPGGDYSDAISDPLGGGIDLRKVWLHGANAGDKIKFSADEIF